MASSDWQFLSPMGVPQPGTPVHGGGGGQALAGYRDILDARRSAAGPRTPDAEYPDGYLGNVNSRREDRLLQNVQTRLTSRNYQRGVHKGEKIGDQAYFWTADLHPMSGIEAQAQGRRWGAIGSSPAEQINHMGKNHMLSPEELGKTANQYGVNEIQPMDPVRKAKFQSQLPSWR